MKIPPTLAIGFGKAIYRGFYWCTGVASGSRHGGVRPSAVAQNRRLEINFRALLLVERRPQKQNADENNQAPGNLAFGLLLLRRRRATLVLGSCTGAFALFTLFVASKLLVSQSLGRGLTFGHLVQSVKHLVLKTTTLLVDATLTRAALASWSHFAC